MKKILLIILAISLLTIGCTPEKQANQTIPESKGAAASAAGADINPPEKESPSPELLKSFGTRDLDNQTQYLGEIMATHKITVINFWASWCGPCVQELPELEALYQTYKDQGVAFVGVLLDGGEKAGLQDGKDLLKTAGVSYLNVLPTPALQNITNLMYIPTTVIMNEKGEMVGGPVVGADPATYDRLIQALLK